MEIIKPNVEIIMEPDNLKRIEIAGRTCYKSESAITDDSAQKFYQSLVRRGHTSVLEHSNIILKVKNYASAKIMRSLLDVYQSDDDIPTYIRHSVCDGVFSGSVRSWRNLASTFENLHYAYALFSNVDLLSDLFATYSKETIEAGKRYIEDGIGTDILTEHTEPIHNIITARFTCSRAMSHELVRHRLMGISQESQRYVKYGELTVIEPYWWGQVENPKHEVMRTIFLNSNLQAEHNYAAYMDCGMPPQAARGALTNDTKTEVVLTGTIPAWHRFIDLRDSSAAHPDIQILARKFISRVNQIPEMHRWELL